MPATTAGFVNASLMGPIPRDRIHLYLLGGLSVAMAGLFLWYPVHWMRRRGLRRAATLPIAAGVGSRLSGWLGRRHPGWAIAAFPVVALLIGAVVAAFPYARDLALGLDELARIALSAALLLPLGVGLGMPFPLGIAALSRLAPSLVPWAWGVNGFMTVVGSLIAALLSIRWGFDLTLLAGAAVYLVAMGAWCSLDA